MVLLNDVVEVLHLADNDRNSAAGIDLINGRLVGAALVHRDLLRNIIGLHGLVKEAHGRCLVALGRQQEVDRFSLFVHGAVEILPDAFDQDAGLIHAPAPSRWALVFAKDLFKQWQKPDRPAVDRRMVDEHASLLHHFLKMAIAQRIRRLPTDAYQNDGDWEAHPFGSQHLVSSLFSQSAQHSRVAGLTVNATEPRYKGS